MHAADALLELSCSSWVELEQKLVRSLKTTARFGQRKSLSRIGLNNGFMSVCCLLLPDWTGCSHAERSRLPAKLVYKFSCPDELEAVAINLLSCRLDDDVIYHALRRSNNTEGLFYSLLDASTADWLSVPSPLCCKQIVHDGDVGHVMMEHVEGTSFPCYEHCSISEVQQILTSIARLQCLSTKQILHQRTEFSWNPWKTIGTAVLTKKVARNVVADIPGFYGVEFKPLTNKLLLALDDFYDVEVPMRERKNISPVLVHGDIWQSNLMWSNGCDRQRQLQAVLDWQSAHVGSPAEDLVFLLCCLLIGEDRRAYSRSLLVFLYRCLESELAPARPSFSLDDLLASYARLFPVLGFIVLIRFSIIFKCSLPSLSPEQRIKFSRNMSRKLFFLAEDVVSAFENLRRTRTKCTH